MIKRIIKDVFNKISYDLLRKNGMFSQIEMLMGIIKRDKEFEDIYKYCKDYTMLSIERIYALYNATRYIVEEGIQGDIVECGVWKGGSAMIAASVLKNRNALERKFYLYDTYSGMSEPTERDIDFRNKPAKVKYSSMQKGNISSKWCYSSLLEVKKNLFSTGYPEEQFIFVEGKVEETIPGVAPDIISLLHLDTDWYESIYHELCHLFPKLSIHGVISIDDYGHWQGAKKAVDKYFSENKIRILLNMVDYTGRIAIKTRWVK